MKVKKTVNIKTPMIIPPITFVKTKFVWRLLERRRISSVEREFFWSDRRIRIDWKRQTIPPIIQKKVKQEIIEQVK